MSRLQDVLQVGDRASQPLATTVPNGTLYAVDDEGFLIEQSDGTTWSQYGPNIGSGGAAPANATYITQTANGSLSAEQALAALSTGIMKVTTVTGVVSSLAIPLTAANGGTGLTNGAGIAAATVSLTDANVKALPTTAFQLVGAPGAGFINFLISAQIIARCSGGAYTNINAAGFGYIQYNGGYVYSNLIGNDATLTPARAYLTALLGNAQKSNTQLVPFTDAVQTSQWGNMAVPFNVTAAENKALELFINNGGSGNLTGGNAANNMTVVTTYVTVAVP